MASKGPPVTIQTFLSSPAEVRDCAAVRVILAAAAEESESRTGRPKKRPKYSGQTRADPTVDFMVFVPARGGFPANQKRDVNAAMRSFSPSFP